MPCLICSLPFSVPLLSSPAPLFNLLQRLWPSFHPSLTSGPFAVLLLGIFQLQIFAQLDPFFFFFLPGSNVTFTDRSLLFILVNSAPFLATLIAVLYYTLEFSLSEIILFLFSLSSQNASSMGAHTISFLPLRVPGTEWVTNECFLIEKKDTIRRS